MVAVAWLFWGIKDSSSSASSSESVGKVQLVRVILCSFVVRLIVVPTSHHREIESNALRPTLAYLRYVPFRSLHLFALLEHAVQKPAPFHGVGCFVVP